MSLLDDSDLKEYLQYRKISEHNDISTFTSSKWNDSNIRSKNMFTGRKNPEFMRNQSISLNKIKQKFLRVNLLQKLHILSETTGNHQDNDFSSLLELYLRRLLYYILIIFYY